MKIGTLLTVNGIIATAFGIAFFAAPGQTLAPYGVEMAGPGLLVARLFGGTLIGYGLITWRFRNTTDAVVLRSLAIALAVPNVLGTIVSAYGALSGQVNALGWSTVAIYGFFTAGYAWFATRGPAPATAGA